MIVRRFSQLLPQRVAWIWLAAAGISAATVVQPQIARSADGAGFDIAPVPPPARNDAANDATFTLVEGEAAGGGLEALNDGVMPLGEDEPRSNFFFRGGNGGRIVLDLGEVKPVKAVHSYSWHPGSRAPQVYKLYGADGSHPTFDAAPKRETDPLKAGWLPVAKVDTRPESGDSGGQHAVAVTPPLTRPLGNFRYLLFDIEPAGDGSMTETFFSEIDVVLMDGPEPDVIKPQEKIVRHFKSEDGKYEYILDATIAPDLLKWSEKELLPVIREWYPKIAEMLPSKGFEPAETILFEYREDMGGTPAYAAGNRVAMSAPWFRNELEREARGCVVHEMVHVVQDYGRARHTNRNPKPTPGWVTEGVADYVRWFLYEPESKGAELHAGNIGNARFDASYRTTANFINWVVETHEPELLRKLNAAAREGDYSPDLWKEWTGKSVDELGADWIADNEKQLGRRNRDRR